MTALAFRSRQPGPSAVRAKRTESSLRWWLFAPAVIVVASSFIVPLFLPYDPVGIVGRPSEAPNPAHWFGTDQNGMDVFSRVFAAAGTDLVIAAVATLGATVAGVILGVIGGMNEVHRGIRGLLARGLARAMDILDAVPSVITGLVLVALFRASPGTIILALIIVALPRQAKLVRTEVLKVRTDAYVDAARMAGVREEFVMLGTVLPNSIRPALENMSAVFGVAIIIEAALGFLGVGLPPPTPEWGTMIAVGASDALNFRWWGAAFPTLALVVTVSSIALAGSELLRRRH